jgi:hypothetical protein
MEILIRYQLNTRLPPTGRILPGDVPPLCNTKLICWGRRVTAGQPPGGLGSVFDPGA